MQLPSADSDLLIRRPCAAHEWTGRAARAGHALCDSTTVRGRCLVSTRPRRAHHRAAFRATHRERTPVRPGALARRAHAPARLPCRTPQQYHLCIPPPLAQKSRPPLVRATSRRRTSPSLVADSLRSARSLSQLVARSMPARSTCRERAAKVAGGGTYVQSTSPVPRVVDRSDPIAPARRAVGPLSGAGRYERVVRGGPGGAGGPGSTSMSVRSCVDPSQMVSRRTSRKIKCDRELCAAHPNQRNPHRSARSDGARRAERCRGRAEPSGAEPRPRPSRAELSRAEPSRGRGRAEPSRGRGRAVPSGAEAEPGRCRAEAEAEPSRGRAGAVPSRGRAEPSRGRGRAGAVPSRGRAEPSRGRGRGGAAPWVGAARPERSLLLRRWRARRRPLRGCAAPSLWSLRAARSSPRRTRR